MSFDTIMVPIPGSEPNPVIMETGIRTAKATGAHVVGIYIDKPRAMGARAPIPAYSVSTLQAQSLGQMAEEAAEDAAAQEERLERRFQELCAEHGVAYGVGQAAGADGPSAAWHREEGDLMDVIDGRAPEFDVVVAAGQSVSRIERDIADHVLRHCERPVLLSSARADRSFDGKAAIAWHPSPQCWHAVAVAMPLLEHAKDVSVISVCDRKNRDKIGASQEELVDYLKVNGLKAQSRLADRTVRKIPDAIMTEATEAGAELLVMGAYSHSPWQEMIFGGVTRTMLSRAASTPVLMAH